MADARRHLAEIVRRVFPPHADVHEIPSGDIRIRADWNLGDDPERPNKRSRPIEVVISEEAVEDYTSGSVEGRRQADERLRLYLSTCLKSFRAEHDVARHIPIPAEEWVVNTRRLNG